jgi:hypothetical protein
MYKLASQEVFQQFAVVLWRNLAVVSTFISITHYLKSNLHKQIISQLHIIFKQTEVKILMC